MKRGHITLALKIVQMCTSCFMKQIWYYLADQNSADDLCKRSSDIFCNSSLCSRDLTKAGLQKHKFCMPLGMVVSQPQPQQEIVVICTLFRVAHQNRLHAIEIIPGHQLV